MSKDLRNANIYFMPLGGEFKDKLLETLNKQKYIFQKYLSTARLESRFTPKIYFYIDDTFDEAEKITKLLLNKKVSRDLENE
jgi:ribosome-binding factor A